MEIENIKFVDELADCLPIPLPEDDFDYSVGYLDEYNVFIKDIKSKQIEIINFEEMLNKENCK